jgi:hypothetical protein
MALLCTREGEGERAREGSGYVRASTHLLRASTHLYVRASTHLLVPIRLPSFPWSTSSTASDNRFILRCTHLNHSGTHRLLRPAHPHRGHRSYRKHAPDSPSAALTLLENADAALQSCGPGRRQVHACRHAGQVSGRRCGGVWSLVGRMASMKPSLNPDPETQNPEAEARTVGLCMQIHVCSCAGKLLNIFWSGLENSTCIRMFVCLARALRPRLTTEKRLRR